MLWLSTGCRPISASRRSTSSWPACLVSCCTVVSAGDTEAASGMSSKPVTATSCGTRSPASRRARIAPMAIRSLAAQIASIGSPRASSAWQACWPEASVVMASCCSAGSALRPRSCSAATWPR
ncbi:hypothetical protein G6F57_020782 [Rhizopus arrhizus]|nr:hypothetical protein G6F57_020782 [Rhizopus arrhizus]